MQRYAITDRSLLLAHPDGLLSALSRQMEQWVAGGVDWVQLRERDLPEDTLLTLAARLAVPARAPGSRTKLLVNGLPPEAAAALGVHGVHLRGGASANAVRHAAALAGCVSVSCHTLLDVEAARDGGATLALWSPVFGKTVEGREVTPGSGLDRLRQACAEAQPMPVFALGGISAGRAADCMEAGAAGIAGIRLFHGEGWHSLR